MPADGRKYKSWELYVCIALNRLVQELDIDLYQEGLDEKIDDILEERGHGLTKFEIGNEIKSNHHMTNKVLKNMEETGMISIESEGRSYRIKITKEGVMHARKFNEFYLMMYRDFLLDHYKYRELPAWFKSD